MNAKYCFEKVKDCRKAKSFLENLGMVPFSFQIESEILRDIMERRESILKRYAK